MLVWKRNNRSGCIATSKTINGARYTTTILEDGSRLFETQKDKVTTTTTLNEKDTVKLVKFLQESGMLGTLKVREDITSKGCTRL